MNSGCWTPGNTAFLRKVQLGTVSPLIVWLKKKKKSRTKQKNNCTFLSGILCIRYASLWQWKDQAAPLPSRRSQSTPGGQPQSTQKRSRACFSYTSTHTNISDEYITVFSRTPIISQSTWTRQVFFFVNYMDQENAIFAWRPLRKSINGAQIRGKHKPVTLDCLLHSVTIWIAQWETWGLLACGENNSLGLHGTMGCRVICFSSPAH